MSARDDLAKVIYTSHRGNTQVDLLDNRRLQGSQLAWARLAADTLVASGWRKSRTIVTIEELDALPFGSVILDPTGLSLHKNEFTGWCASNGAKNIDAEMLECEALPATVLHEPEAGK